MFFVIGILLLITGWILKYYLIRKLNLLGYKRWGGRDEPENQKHRKVNQIIFIITLVIATVSIISIFMERIPTIQPLAFVAVMFLVDGISQTYFEIKYAEKPKKAIVTVVETGINVTVTSLFLIAYPINII